MADALVSSLVSTILCNLNNLVLGESAILGSLRSQLENLESTLTTIQAVLHDAEEKQWKSTAVKNWLRKLKDVAYDADDVLDEFDIEVQRLRKHRDMKNRVRLFFSLQNPLVFQVTMGHKLKNVSDKLDAIAKEKDKFHLKEGVRDTEVDSFDWRQTSSLVNESEIYGRQSEKEEVITKLLANVDDFLVYAVCGMGGLGKTALAQLVYNDERVESHFDLRIWVCVSDDFDIRRLTRAIIESIEGCPPNNQELDPLQRRLQEKLNGRKFLLILDDVWNEYADKWNGLYNALRCGARGSAILITTRMEKIALMMATAPVQHINRLSDDDSWLLFVRLAFGMRPREEYAHLETIGRGIVKKCGGVPLAVKALGSLMRFKRLESEWLSIKESNTWDLPDEGKTILPALKLSYDHLPPHLRQCLSFCCIFPKDYEMRKDDLIELWMANGFISSRGQMELHDMGHEIFSELVLRSFFEIKKYSSDYITCTMHDLVHDLAKSIMQHECYLIEPNKALEVQKGVRHLAIHSYHSLLPIPRYKELRKVQTLRSFLHLPWTQCDDVLHYFTGQKHLRVLHLDGSTFNKLPMSISKLKHLRYLNFSHSYFKSLQESITSLQKLQTLNLSYCHNLCTLPKGMKHMKNLINFNITSCSSLSSMPAGIGQMTCLRKLSMFIVGKNVGYQVGELKELNLEGKLCIKDLHNVNNLMDARVANLTGKKNLESLELIWKPNNGISNSAEVTEDTLCGLQPHSNVKNLMIDGYGGSKFPYWIMDLLTPNLVEISLDNCSRCEHLPPLGKLQFLKVLRLSGMHAVKCIDKDMYGYGETSFPSLETFSLGGMHSLQEWAMVGGKDIFPHLRKLIVRDCSKLLQLPVIPSVKTLEICGGSVLLLASVQSFTSLVFLNVFWFPEVTHLPNGLLQNHALLEHLEINGLFELETLSNQLDKLCALKTLNLISCEKLETLPEGLWNLNSLERLTISGCGIESFPSNEFCSLASLRSLNIQSCHRFTSFSEGLQYLTSLEHLSVYECRNLNSLHENIGHLTALQKLSISGSNGLSSLPNHLGHLTSLHRLKIAGCHDLMRLPEAVKNLKRLRELNIRDCPYLEKKCQKDTGEDWPKIAHIPVICINYQLLQYSPP